MNGRSKHVWRKGKAGGEQILNTNLVCFVLLSLILTQSLAFSVEEQTITASDLIQQDIDINEPVGNLKKLLEPRIQISLDAYDICLQDIQVTIQP